MSDAVTTAGLNVIADGLSTQLHTHAETLVDYAHRITAGPLLRILTDRHRMNPEDAQTRVRVLSRSVSAAAQQLAEAARRLHTITVDVEVLHDDAGTTGDRTWIT